jgi:hypothetical protein
VGKTILTELKKTKGERSTSERVNEPLKRALDLEKRERLQQAAALFYSDPEDRREEAAFQKESLRSIVGE